jgi:phosphatidylglycerol:prolipoprotein diacylglycerol transferase
MNEKVNYWVDNLDPFIFRIHGDIGVRYYGVAYLLGFVAAIFLLKLYYKKGKSPLDSDQVDNSIFAIVAGVLVGGRVGYIIFYAWPAFCSDPLTLFKVWQGGMSSHGGFIGVIIAALWIARRQKIPFMQLADILASVTPIGLFFGRIANFINGELWGKVTNVPWAVIFPKSAPPDTPVMFIEPRHPSQLYEASLEGLFLFIYLQVRFWFGKTLKSPGRLSGEFLILYAIVRILGEQFREPDAALIMGVSRGIFYSYFMILAGVAFIVYSIRNPLKEKTESDA